MLSGIVDKVISPKTRHLATTGLGVGALMLGKKKVGVTLFLTGLGAMERHWREEHQFEGTWPERWDHAIRFYEDTHSHSTNRYLHMAGIPTIVGGTLGLLFARPYSPLWFASNGAFIFGWGLNFVGHGFYEKNAPAFQDDPLSFVAGPVWDIQEFRKLRNAAPTDEADAAE